MKSIIEILNELLASEHAAYVQYTLHARICENFGYKKLVEYLTKRADEEKEHASELIDRILFLKGVPDFVSMTEVKVGDSVIDMFPFDKEAELKAIADYNQAIEIAFATKDNGTRLLLEHILAEEERHFNDIEISMLQIVQIGIENYLTEQMR